MTKPNRPTLPVWQRYWKDNKSPHPDTGKAQSPSIRVLAPFARGSKAHYCHHYRQEGEHYHSSMNELEACPL